MCLCLSGHSFPVGLAGGGGSKRPGTQSASSRSAGSPCPLLPAPDTHPYLSDFQAPPPPPFVLKPPILDPALPCSSGFWEGQGDKCVVRTRRWQRPGKDRTLALSAEGFHFQRAGWEPQLALRDLIRQLLVTGLMGSESFHPSSQETMAFHSCVEAQAGV